MIHRLLALFFSMFFLCLSNLALAEPIQVGGSLGLTGRYAPLAIMQKRAFELWVEQTNAQGGLLGRPLVLTILDDQSDPTHAIKQYQHLLEEKKVDLLLAPYSSTLTQAVMPLVEKHGLPMLASGAASDKLWQHGYKNLFGLFTPASRYSVGFLELIALQGITEVAIVHADDGFSRALATGAKQWAERFGLQVVLQQQFKKGRADLTPLAQAVKKTQAPALLVCGHFHESVRMRQALHKVTYQPQAYFATVGPVLPRYKTELGALAEDSFSASQWEPEALHHPKDRARFTQPFIDRFKVAPSYHAADAYAAGQILTAAVKKMGTLDRNALRQSLRQNSFISIIGRYGVDKSGNQIRHFPLTIQWQNGKKSIVWPDTLASSQPQFGPAANP
ncbi:amino acid ABC transporter substrate-binding protein [Magnetococcus sp. PR-3]|uniref:amino acid ABC transporter substrate-binding protein n=1 Tax=Magnetococcus sp. PR-3 TaxID=3120355 RepID=UPI002FCE1D9C